MLQGNATELDGEVTVTRPARVSLPVVRMPATRAECQGEGLCLKLSCRYNLTLDVTRAGSLVLQQRHHRLVWPAGVAAGTRDARYPGWRPSHEEVFADAVVATLEAQEVNCALDVADMGGAEIEHIAAVLGVTVRHAKRMLARALRMARGRLGEVTCDDDEP